MGNPEYYDGPKTGLSQSLINRLYGVFSDDLPFAAPVFTLRTNEVQLVRGVLQMLQGFPSSLFYWDDSGNTFRSKNGIYVAHLSQTSLDSILNQFTYSATCLQLVEITVNKVETSSIRTPPPTLRAFANSVSVWLKRLRHVALREEIKICASDSRMTPTLLGLTNALSSLCSGAEYLLQVVREAIPGVYFEPQSSVPSGEMAVYILDHLYKKLNEVCLVQGGEEEAYQMLLFIFVGSILPYIEGLDFWLYDGTLDDPFEEMFFYANKEIAIDHSAFWEKSYLLRPLYCRKIGSGLSSVTSARVDESVIKDKKEAAGKESISISSSTKGKDQNDIDLEVCPLFIKDIAKAIVSAGKSLQLIRHVSVEYATVSDRGSNLVIDGFGRLKGNNDVSKTHHGQSLSGLTLSEVFCVSLAALIDNGNHISEYFWQDDSWNSKIFQLFESYMDKQKLSEENGATSSPSTYLEKTWCKLLVDTMLHRKEIYLTKDGSNFHAVKENNRDAILVDESSLNRSFCPENPVITVCQTFLNKNRSAWGTLNLSGNFHLPPLNDESLREAIFGGNNGLSLSVKGTDYTSGFQFGESQTIEDDTKTLESLYPFPTILPLFQDDLHISEVIPFQKNSTLSSKVLNWILTVEPKSMQLPVVIIHECLTMYIKKQVDYVGRHILLKLMKDWRLMDELGVLRAIYLLGSGDLLQQFLTVLFNKLDKGESWDDDFELNTILQESIRNSADVMLLSAPDSLVVSITKDNVSNGDGQHNTATLVSTPHKVHNHCFGIDALDLLKFSYKVPWPLELIANTEAIKKYNQVMSFLLKVKRAKFVLDKARRWMWKGRGDTTVNRMHHWLVEQKLLHFVDAFHQYVMDRVYHSAWLELCECMALAGSLDEVIEVHEAYLLSIQRQCFVVPDKLWALIASRIKSILGLALDFYSIQQTLSSGGAAPAIKARCEMEIGRIEKQFDDCIAFLLRVLSFKLNVGHFPHLADLVTRINYNFFYMSDSGNLLTVPGAETTFSKVGKTFPVRSN